MVPFPVTVPRAGIVKLIFCVRTPSGATRASVLRFWMEVSDPLCDPDKAEMADILDERLKPASLVCASRIGPTITNLSTGSESRQHGLEVVYRHAVSIEFHVQYGGLTLTLVCTGKFGQGLAQGNVTLGQRSPLLLQIKVGGVLHRHRLGGRRAFYRQLEFGRLQCSAGS